MKKAVEIHQLCKKYELNHEAGYATLVEAWTSFGKKMFNRLCNPYSQRIKNREQFSALEDLSFEVEEGDRVALIGKNGAGKSTLLKILSRITAPTSGRVKVRGRLSSLLEVGTGFHPELTGRENIYLNGAILGMKRDEIKSKFDEIVAFSELEKFLDTPVKRYSSGMYMRLGFAVAAHLDADILVIDEVLAVGDIQFQQKCFKKLNDLGTKGRTVLFVSHDIGSVLSLCNRGVYLDKGKLIEVGPIESCVASYMKNYRDRTLSWEGDLGDEHIRIYKAALGREDQEFFYQRDIPTLSIDYEVLKPHRDLFFGVSVWNERHQLLAKSTTLHTQEKLEGLDIPGRRRLSFALNAGLFHESEYLVKLSCGILNKKKITEDEIVLKFPVYHENKETRLSHGVVSEGVFLGSEWSDG